MPRQKFLMAANSFTLQKYNTASDYKIKPLLVYYSEILLVCKSFSNKDFYLCKKLGKQHISI